MRNYKRSILSRYYVLRIFLRRITCNETNEQNICKSIFDLRVQFSEKKKIVVICNGPSANLAHTSIENLYLVTNSGKTIVEGLDFLYYLNDPMYVLKLLGIRDFISKGQELLFYYDDSKLHKKAARILFDNLKLLNKHKNYFISNLLNESDSNANFIDFQNFYKKRGLPIKIQNSGMFILLFGYYLAVNMKLPLEIYGLDMGVGGLRHFNDKGFIGQSVTRDGVKKNVKIYLDHIYQENFVQVNNYSYFNPN